MTQLSRMWSSREGGRRLSSVAPLNTHSRMGWLQWGVRRGGTPNERPTAAHGLLHAATGMQAGACLGPHPESWRHTPLGFQTTTTLLRGFVGGLRPHATAIAIPSATHAQKLSLVHCSSTSQSQQQHVAARAFMQLRWRGSTPTPHVGVLGNDCASVRFHLALPACPQHTVVRPPRDAHARPWNAQQGACAIEPASYDPISPVQ